MNEKSEVRMTYIASHLSQYLKGTIPVAQRQLWYLYTSVSGSNLSSVGFISAVSLNYFIISLTLDYLNLVVFQVKHWTLGSLQDNVLAMTQMYSQHLTVSVAPFLKQHAHVAVALDQLLSSLCKNYVLSPALSLASPLWEVICSPLRTIQLGHLFSSKSQRALHKDIARKGSKRGLVATSHSTIGQRHIT